MDKEQLEKVKTIFETQSDTCVNAHRVMCDYCLKC